MKEDNFLEDIMIMESYDPLKDSPNMQEYMDKKYGKKDWYFMTGYMSKSSGLVDSDEINKNYIILDTQHTRVDFDGNTVTRDLYKRK